MRSAKHSHKATVPFILAQLQVSEDELRAQGLEAKTFTAIYNDYTSRLHELEDIAQLVTSTLERQQDVHAVRHRVKEPLHLLKKIIRKKKEYPKRNLDIHNYLEYINDLVGVRTLHLYKEACHSIGEYIQQVWELKRTPYAYVSNEHSAHARLFAANQYNIMVNDRGYTAQHFILKVKPNRQQYLVEVQVKTLIEEGWSEIDHCIRYPDHEPNELLNRLLWLLSQFTMKADAVASQIQALAEELHKYNHPQAEPEVTIAQLRSHIEDLPVDEQERQYLFACLAKQTGG